MDTIDADDPGEDFDDCGYTGGVHVTVSSDSESLYELVESKQEDTQNSDAESLVELEGDKLKHNLQSLRLGVEVEQLSVSTPYSKIMKRKTAKE